jgi:prevent-host-death family protein
MLYKMSDIDAETVTAAECKAHLADVLRKAERGDVVVITRYGRPVAALVSAEEAKQLQRLRARSPADGLVGLVGRWRDSEELVAELDRLDRETDATRAIPAVESSG